MRKTKKRLIRAAAAALTLAALALPASAATIGGAVVHTNDTGLNLRAEATTGSNSLAMLPNGTFLLVEAALDGWYQVVWNGQTGYVSANYVDYAAALDGGYDFNAATLGTDVNIRAGADVSAQLVKCLPAAGSALTVTGVVGNWLKIRDAAGTEGYIRSDLVRYTAGTAAGETTSTSASPVQVSQPQAVTAAVTVTETSAPAASALGAQIAAAAEQYLGYSYVWGGASPSTGFDCSGLVYYLFGQNGISLQRSAQDMYDNNGSAVSYSEIQPGDLLFFGYGEDCVTHVAIYTGGGYMIHSSTYGVGVIRSNVESSGYYNRMYVGAKRVA